MKKRAGVAAIISLALVAAVLLAFVQMRYSPTANSSPPVASVAAAGETSALLGREAEPPEPLPFGEVQHVTVKAFIVKGLDKFEATASQDGASFTVASELKPGQGYEIHLALNNASTVTQAVDLVVDAPDDMSVEIDMPSQVEQQAPDRWTLVAAPTGQGDGGYFDFIIYAYASRYMSLERSKAVFTLNQ